MDLANKSGQSLSDAIDELIDVLLGAPSPMLTFILQAQHVLADRKTATGEPWLVEVKARNLESAIETVRKNNSCPLLISPMA